MFWKHGSMEDEDASGDLPGLTSGSPPIGASEFSSSQEEPLISKRIPRIAAWSTRG